MIEPSKEGTVPVLGYQLFYRSYGQERGAGTVLCLHGGPGASHEYLSPLADLSQFGYRVVLFDQLACGRSEDPHDESLFTLAHHVEEVEGIRRALDLGRVHLMGSSYGGLLALSYALKYQDHLRSLISTGGLASIPLTVAEMRRLRSELPPEVRSVLEHYEELGEFQDPEYLKAVDVFYRKHICRLPEWPEDVVRTFSNMGRVYQVMNGPNEFTITGRIKDVDITADLGQIRVPCLITTGRYDEVTSQVAQSIHDHIPGSRLVMFENSSHLPMWEERERYIEVLRDFLRSVDAPPQG
jgi:proline iminopeptidase